MRQASSKKINPVETIQFARRLTVIALFADDMLMNTFVLKGGNAINLVYGLSDRSSIDIDVSMAGDFLPDQLEDIRLRLEKALIKTFSDHKLEVFDVLLKAQPKTPYADVKEFWGGYHLAFKVIEQHKGGLPLESRRKQALLLGPDRSASFKVDISKFECCEAKEAKTFDDYTIYVYSPVMLVYEKLRAVCQQISSYAETVHQQSRQRARDFYDIYTLVTGLNLESRLFVADNLLILHEIFAAKRVPLNLLTAIHDYKDFHAVGFETIAVNISDKSKLRDFDFYFDYVVELAARLNTAREK